MKRESLHSLTCCSDYLETWLGRSDRSGLPVDGKQSAVHIPRLTRRDFMRVGGVTVGGYFLMPLLQPRNVEATEKVEPRGGAEIAIVLFLFGGPPQMDTFDVKEGAWTPEDLDIQTVKPGLRMPVGLLPKLSKQTDKYAMVRSLESWEREHGRGAYYVQVGKLKSPARTAEIPSVGSVVAYETASRRKESDFLPPFISMNMMPSILIGSGLLPSQFSPMALGSADEKYVPPPFVLPEEEKAVFERRRLLLKQMDRTWRDQDPHRGPMLNDLHRSYQDAYPILDNPKTAPIFNIKPEDHERYGASGLGDACVMARNLVQANAGTRFIFIAHGGWDLHADIYNKSSGVYGQCAELDGALANLLVDLESQTDDQGRRLIDKTFITAMGEFGRTPGKLNPGKGRDHHPYANVALFAGAGVKSKVLGVTNDSAGKVVDPQWHKGRSIYPEDVFATLYSVMGIDWTKKITQTPSGRAFEYIENFTTKGITRFGEIPELFA